MLNRQKQQAAPWALLAAALFVRLLLALVTEGYPYDLGCFLAWGERLITVGPAAFYAPDYFADYPPGYLWVLGFVALLRRLLGAAYGSALSQMLLALAPAVCDCAIAALVWRTARQYHPQDPPAAFRLAAFTAFCPLLLFDTAVWKQIDGAFALPLLLCFWLLERKKYLPAAFLFGVALAIKPQALLAGPVLAVCFVLELFTGSNRRRAVRDLAGGVGLALLAPLLLSLPFYGAGVVPGLVEKYWGTAGSYPYASINAFNWLAALGANWKPLTDRLYWGGVPTLTWQTLGVLGIAAITAALLVLTVRSVRAKRFSPLLLAGFYTVGIYVFAHCMHERYVVLGALLVLLAAARWNDRGLYAAGFGLSLTGLINMATVYTLVGTDDEWMSSATSTLVVRLTGLAATACFVLLALACWRLTAPQPQDTPAQAESPAPGVRVPTDIPAGQPRWTRREVAAVVLLTVLTAAVSFANLGELRAPQTVADANGGTLVYTARLLPSASLVTELWIYPGISTYNNGRLTVTDAAGETVVDYGLIYTTPFTWARQDISLAGPGPYTITLTDGALVELCFRDANGNKIGLDAQTGAELDARMSLLFDEQHLVPDTVSYLNSFYFDEIYHARTGYEQLHALQVYETTHPPLGKDLIMVGIALFGMTGFGWRFSGTLFGVLLVPLAWCFARRLTRKRWVGAVAGVLLALDFMRFAQSRIATIDIYGTFFILLGAHCMVWYCQSVLQKGVHKSLVPMALGGLAFGLGCAAKWTGIYAGAGLAVLYFGVLWARRCQNPPEYWREFRTAAVGGVTFYVVLPLVIYLASYLPYTWRDPGFGLGGVWNSQLYMFRYHSGLEATHAFESRWYTWLLGLRPVWYYSNGNLPPNLRGTIAGLAGPVIWVAGLVCIVRLLWRQVSGKGSPQGAAVLILYATQLLPWMLVTRCTFLYHYFPSSMFCLAAVAITLAQSKHQQAAKRLAVGLCGAAALLFALYYPVLSGVPVAAGWISALRVLPSFGF